jgi:hypothetical protein
VASRGESPSSLMMRSTFSTTTIASSTSSPIASTIANIVSMLIEYPKSPSDSECAKYDDRHGDGRNERGADVAQKEVHHQEYEEDSLE